MNKMLLGITSIVMILGANSMAIDFMGPPTASLDSGQWKIGYTFDCSRNDVLAKNIQLDGVDTGLDEVTIGMKVTRNYFTFNYGIEPRRWEVYGFLGLGNAKESDSLFISGENIRFNSNNNFAFGIGTKVTTNSSDNVDWGVLFQTSWLKADDELWSGTFDYSGDTYSGKWDAEFDAWEMQIAVGPTIKNEGWKIYGGPFVHIVGGNVEEKLSGTINGDPASAKITGKLRQDQGIGGYIGAQIDFGKNCAFAVEYAYTGSSEGIGGNVSWKF